MYQLKKISVSILLLIISTVSWAHPIKMTTGKLELNTKDKTCVLTLNFFIDDFKAILKTIYPLPEFDFEHADENMTVAIQDYISRNFDLMIDHKPVSFLVKNIEQIESNVCQVTLSGNIYSFERFEIATIKDALFFSSFSKQSNILHLIVNKNTPKILQFYKTVPVRTERLP
ncbi:MAG: DUF6702 family protein [Prolixibacteraceae bacterium]